MRAESAAATLGFFVPTFKNPRFEAEAEWRLIFTPGPTCQIPPKFRTARGLLVPYFELVELVKIFANPEQLGIRSVCVGPGPYKDINARSARMLLDNYGFTKAPVNRSEIPYADDGVQSFPFSFEGRVRGTRRGTRRPSMRTQSKSLSHLPRRELGVA